MLSISSSKVKTIAYCWFETIEWPEQDLCYTNTRSSRRFDWEPCDSFERELTLNCTRRSARSCSECFHTDLVRHRTSKRFPMVWHRRFSHWDKHSPTCSDSTAMLEESHNERRYSPARHPNGARWINQSTTTMNEQGRSRSTEATLKQSKETIRLDAHLPTDESLAHHRLIFSNENNAECETHCFACCSRHNPSYVPSVETRMCLSFGFARENSIQHRARLILGEERSSTYHERIGRGGTLLMASCRRDRCSLNERIIF